MANERMFLWLALACYFVSSLVTIRRLRAGGASAVLHRVNFGLMIAGFALHTTFMILRGQQLHRCPLTNFTEVLVFIAWAAVMFYLLIGTAYRISFLGAFTSPLVFTICLAALVIPLDVPRAATSKHSAWVEAHAAIGAIAYGAFALAGVAGAMYLVQEHQLKSRRLMPAFLEMPAISQLDTINFRSTLMGFGLLSVSMLGGVISHHVLGRTPVPKVIWAWAVWFVFAFALFARHKWDWRGRKAAWMSVSSFAFVLVTFWVMSVVQDLYRATP